MAAETGSKEPSKTIKDVVVSVLPSLIQNAPALFWMSLILYWTLQEKHELFSWCIQNVNR